MGTGGVASRPGLHILMNIRLLRFLPSILCAASAAVAAPATLIFETRTLSREFHSEGGAVGDFDHDGKRDIVSGPNVYFGPDFKKTSRIYEGTKFDVRAYSKNFLTYVHDLTGDGWDDVLVLGFPGEEGYWFENPRKAEAKWSRHVAMTGLDNESPTFTDVTGDLKPEIVCSFKEQFGYAEPNWQDPTQPWKFTAISAVIPGMGRFSSWVGVRRREQGWAHRHPLEGRLVRASRRPPLTAGVEGASGPVRHRWVTNVRL